MPIITFIGNNELLIREGPGLRGGSQRRVYLQREVLDAPEAGGCGGRGGARGDCGGEGEEVHMPQRNSRGGLGWVREMLPPRRLDRPGR